MLLTFEPLFMERVWGGRQLAELFGKALPEDVAIGESWEIVDRPEAQSVVDAGPYAGRTLGALWQEERALFGARARGERFPLIVKLLDCSAALSVQVHPPADVAARLGGETKTEMWVVTHAADGAHLLVGLREGVTRAAFEASLHAGDDVSGLLHRIDTAPGDVMVLPSGRLHGIGAGNVIAEIQQNSDTTYRVWDFGRDRELHVEESLQSITWDDHAPALHDGDAVRTEAFEVERWRLEEARPAAPAGECAVLAGLDGPVRIDGQSVPAGRFVIAADADVAPVDGAVTVLRALLPA